eukprot:7077305-Heterocapsa_arctica.AAC.1
MRNVTSTPISKHRVWMSFISIELVLRAASSASHVLCAMVASVRLQCCKRKPYNQIAPPLTLRRSTPDAHDVSTWPNTSF